jgi:hypothetical protein
MSTIEEIDAGNHRLRPFRRPHVDEVVDTHEHNLGLDSSKPADTTDFVTHSTLTRLLDERDTDLKQLITSKLDSVMGAIDALRPPAIVPPAGTGSARRDLTEDPAFTNSSLPPPGKSCLWRGSTVFTGGAPPDGTSPVAATVGDDAGIDLTQDAGDDFDKDEHSTKHPIDTPVTGHSPLRDNKRGKANAIYLCGERGVYNIDANELLVDDFLTTLGFPINLQADIVARFWDLVTEWTRPDVNPKYFTTSFRKLDTAFSPESFVDWYTHFVYDLQRYDICLVLFDAIVLRWNYVGLCLPGVGEIRYTAMGQALFSILDKVLPSNNPTVSDCIVSLLGFCHDGYRLLYLVMSRTLPVFCPSKPSSPPVWDDTPSVPQMAKLWNLYYRFNVKKGAYFSLIERGLLFLDSLKDHSLVGIVASLKGSLQSFCDSVEEFDSLPPLPKHLTIDGMVQTITTTTSPVTSSMGFARANKLVPLLETPASRANITIPNIQGAEFLSVNATSTRCLKTK